MRTIELEKSKAHMVAEVIEYVSNTVTSRTIIKEATGNVTFISFDVGEKLAGKTTTFDNYIQIIDGVAEIIINEKKHHLKSGAGIIIPASTPHSFNANEKFKMISTIIKSGYGK